MILLKDDNKQNDGEETWGDNDDNINADPTWGNENISLKLTSIALTPMTQEMMIIIMITKAATIAKTVKKEVMMAQQCLFKLCSHCTLKMLKEKVTPESVFFCHHQ